MPEQGGQNLGNAYGKVIIDASGVQVSMNQARNVFRNGIQSIGGSISSLGDQMSQLGSNLTVLTAPITAFGVAGVKAAMDFDSALVEIQARTGATTEAMEQVRQKSLQIGQDTAFSAGQAAAAFLQLLTTGQSLDEAMVTIDQVMAGAAASGADLGFVADSLTDIMAAFGMEATQSGEVMVALAKASGVSSATMTDLVMGFQNVGGVARSFGLSVADTAAILATFSENGIKGAEAGTTLRSMLNNMTRDTDDVQGMWKKLGISMFDAMGKARPLSTVMDELSVKLAAMSDEDRINAVKTLAGNYGQLGLSALTTGDGFDVMLGNMRDAAGATEIAEARMSTFKGSLMFLRGSIETLQIKALTPLMNDVLAPLIKQISEVVNSISEWVSENPELAATITKVLAGVAAAGPVLLIAGKAMSAFGGIISLAGAALGFLLSPIGLVVAAVAGLGLAFHTNFLGIRDAVQPIIDRFVNEWLPSIVNYVETKVLPTLHALVNWFIKDALPTVVAFVETTVVPAVETFVGLLANFWNDIQPGLDAFFNWVVNEGLPMVVDFFNNVIVPAVDAFITILAGIWETISPALTSLFNWFMVEGLPRIQEFIETVVIPIVQTLVDIISTVWTVVQPALQSLFEWFTDKGLPLIQVAIDAVIGVGQAFVELLAGAWEAVKPHVEGLRDGLKAVFDWIVTNVIDPVIGRIEDLLRTVADAKQKIEELLGSAQRAGQTVAQGIQSGAITADDIRNIQSTTAQAMQAEGGLFGTLADIGSVLYPNQFRDSGGAGMAGMPYLIGKGAQPELFVPNTDGQFFPNADRMMGGSSDTYHISVEMPAEALQNPAVAAERGRDFGAAIKAELRRKGALS